SGIHSHNFDGAGFNQWQLDDTPGQVRTRLATSTAATQLNLGYLIAQQASSAQRGAYRGSGFELRTDAWGVVRGGDGVLLSTTARAQQGSGVTSTQLDTEQALAQFHSAHDLGKLLGDTASEQAALFSKDATKAHKAFIEQIDPKAKGKHEGAVGGQDASKAKLGERELDSEQPVEKFGKPIVLMDAPASINWATPASTVVYAGEHLQWTTRSDLHMTAAHTMSSVAANAVNLFTHAGGIQAIAGSGPVSVQAHTDQLEIFADKAVTIISVNESIKISASQKIILQAGQSSITLDGANITFACPGNFTVRGSQHSFDAGKRTDASFAPLPSSKASFYDRRIKLSEEATGNALPNSPYFIRLASGIVFHGMSDNEGFVEMVHGNSPEAGKLFVGHAALLEIDKYSKGS
ncbi:DUF2345 domain-containing protein, partial [Massilia sp. TWP1-3-3]|uniref:DUF2345 domain-containing protein n=1 Tax=Massilia sp. TWP1-3-3 TaxID=2804573 RepID=UPI003CEBCADD